MEFKQPEKSEINFRKLDLLFKYNWQAELYEKIRKDNGYGYVSEYIYDKYYIENLPASKISRNLGMGKNNVYVWMQRWNLPTHKPGGNVKNSVLRKPETIRKIIALRGKVSSNVACKIIGCSATKILKTWKEAA